eukprot:3043590-Prymnesium_polylepis.2
MERHGRADPNKAGRVRCLATDQRELGRLRSDALDALPDLLVLGEQLFARFRATYHGGSRSKRIGERLHGGRPQGRALRSGLAATATAAALHTLVVIASIIRTSLSSTGCCDTSRLASSSSSSSSAACWMTDWISAARYSSKSKRRSRHCSVTFSVSLSSDFFANPATSCAAHAGVSGLSHTSRNGRPPSM